MKKMKRTLLYITLSAMLAFGSYAMNAEAATVTADVLNVRSGAGTEHSRVGTVTYGTNVTTTDAATGSDGYTWYKISTPVNGYVRGDYLSNITGNEGTSSGTNTSVAGAVGSVIADILNVRSGAGTNYTKLGVITQGASVNINAQEGVWYNVTCTISGVSQNGYVHSDYISITSYPETPSESETETPAESESSPETEAPAETESSPETESTPETEAPPLAEPERIYGIVNCDALNVRSGASTGSGRIGLLYRNAEVEILSQEGSWYKVNCTVDGSVKTGYVYAEYITKKTVNNPSSENQPTQEPILSTTGVGVVNCDALNVRTGASTGASRIGMIYRNETVEILSQEGSWYKVKCSLGGSAVTGYVSAEYITKLSGSSGTEQLSSYVIPAFEVIYQYPELPTGCEITALTMLMRYKGYSVSKTAMASQYLPKQPYLITTGTDGKKYGPDLDYYFVGDPYGTGTVCGAEALVTAGNAYLTNNGSSLRVVNITGSSFEDMYNRVGQNQPVIVLGTIGMENRRSTTGWYTSSGKYVEYSRNDHGAVLIGYSDTTVTIACPIYGTQTYSRAQFEKVMTSRGCQAVVIE